MVDVRQESEWDASQRPNGDADPLPEFPDHLDELPRDRAVHLRVSLGGPLLPRGRPSSLKKGFDAVNLSGGMIAWYGEDLPFESDNGDPSID